MNEYDLNDTEIALLTEADVDIRTAMERKRDILSLIYRARKMVGEYGLSPDNTKLIKKDVPNENN
jgi:hypothetical protein